MKKVLVAYFSQTGTTEAMAQYIAEGVRFSGQQAVLKKISDIKSSGDISGYDGYIFGSPTHYSGIPETFKSFLSTLGEWKEEIKGKPGGAFGSYTHDGNAPGLMFDILQSELEMEPFQLGSLKLKQYVLEETGRDEEFQTQNVGGEVLEKGVEGMRACQDYGRVFGENLG
jgi:flavodoxin